MTDKSVQIKPYPLGAHREQGGVRFSFVSREKECGVVIYDRHSGGRGRRIPFRQEERIGNVYCKYLNDIDTSGMAYQFYEKDRLAADQYARVFINRAGYGKQQDEGDLKAGLIGEDFPWDGDTCPRIPYEDCICYGMHVRGFTRHPSSKAAHRGTFLGIVEKLPYLKELGVTTIELQPAYEFLEIPGMEENKKAVPWAIGSMEPDGEEKEPKKQINYWGYKKGFYYAPKQSYAAGEDACAEFKEMVKAFHKNGMEVVMQFYFPQAALYGEISEILRFWILEYHVDGFHIMGEQLPADMIAADPAFADTKLWYYEFRTESGREDSDGYRNLALYREEYMYDMRRFLKGDADMLGAVLYHMRCNPEGVGRINFFTNYYGFTLADLVSYDHKHNEENGECNRDGSEINQSWNCGVEGPSRKKIIVELRRKQIKNALCLLFFSQATPFLFMGDEFGNTQRGNNNPYCQDNETTWLNWQELARNTELFRFTAGLISLRREHPILHKENELRIMDTISCGYPDLSYHGESAWKPSMDYDKRHIGIMYCGKYALRKGQEDDFFYLAVNMHWVEHEFAMPKLPKGLKWKVMFLTGGEKETVPGNEEKGAGLAKIKSPAQEKVRTEIGENNWQTRNVPARSIAVLISTRDDMEEAHPAKRHSGKYEKR